LKYGLYFSSLTLGYFVIQKKMTLLEFPTLSNLKQLELIGFHAGDSVSLLRLTTLLKAAPILCRLTLKVNGHACVLWDYLVSDSRVILLVVLWFVLIISA